MAVSKVGKKFKISTVKFTGLASLQWSSGTFSSAKSTQFEATGKIVSLTIAGYGALNGYLIPMISESTPKNVVFLTTGIPTRSDAYITLRIIEEL